MYFISIDLELVTSSGMLIIVCFHIGPVIPCLQNLLSHHVPTRIGAKGTFVHICHNLLFFTLVYTLKQSKIVVALVEDHVTEEKLGR